MAVFVTIRFWPLLQIKVEDTGELACYWLIKEHLAFRWQGN